MFTVHRFPFTLNEMVTCAHNYIANLLGFEANEMGFQMRILKKIKIRKIYLAFGLWFSNKIRIQNAPITILASVSYALILILHSMYPIPNTITMYIVNG